MGGQTNVLPGGVLTPVELDGAIWIDTQTKHRLCYVEADLTAFVLLGPPARTPHNSHD